MKQILFFTLLSLYSYAQQDTSSIALETVTVTANLVNTEINKTSRSISIIDRKTIDASPVKTLDGVLQYALNIDVRSRSAFGVQADISIRGGHYDQTLVLVDGIKVNDPQTGHHALNIPVPFSLIEKIEVLQGGASRVFGPSAFSGVINIITKKPTRPSVELQGSVGSYGTWQVGGNGVLIKNNFSLISAYEHNQSDGFIPATDFNKNTASIKTENTYKNGSINASYGFANNDFGASNFYHPKFNNQYEEVSAQLISTAWRHNLSNNLSATLLANYRIHNDMYDFNNYRNTDKISSINFHQTDVMDLEWKFKFKNKWGKSAFGLEYRNEKVKSNRLGDALSSAQSIKNWPNQYYTNGKTRDNYSVFLEHSKEWKNFNLSIGTLGNYNSQFGFALYPGLDLGYSLNNSSKIYYSVNRSLRFPTFTELYLNNSTIVGDPNLKPEKALTQELGFKNQRAIYNGTYAIFYTKTTDALDKIKRPNQDIPRMVNIDDINLFGFETTHSLRISKNKVGLNQVTLNVSWISADRKEDGFQSFYTLNYLKQKASLGLFFVPIKNLSVTGWYTFKNRAGEYSWDATTPAVNYGAYSLIDVRVSYRINKVTMNIDANNLLNKKYFEYGFVAQPPRWISAGLKWGIL